MTETSDPNMDTAIEWANVLGPPPSLPASLGSMERRAKLVDRVDSSLIAGSFLHKLKDEERIQRLNVIVELSRSFLPDVRRIDEIKNVILRLWAGCMSAAKEIAPSTKSGPNTPARRTMIFSQQIDILCQTDMRLGRLCVAVQFLHYTFRELCMVTTLSLYVRFCTCFQMQDLSDSSQHMYQAVSSDLFLDHVRFQEGIKIGLKST